MADNTPVVTPLRRKRVCPECGKTASRETWPFCSERCKSLDLGRWLSGSYAIPVSETAEDPESEARDAPDDIPT